MKLSLVFSMLALARVVIGEKQGSEPLETLIPKEENREAVVPEDAKLEQEGIPLLLKNGAILFTDHEISEEDQASIKDKLSVPFAVTQDKVLAEENKVPFPGLYYISEHGTYISELATKTKAQIEQEISEKKIEDENKKKEIEKNAVEELKREVLWRQSIARIPLFGELTENNYREYDSTRLQTMYLVSYSNMLESFKWIEQSAEKYKSRVKLALLDYNNADFFLSMAGVTKEMAPCLFFIAEKDGATRKYLLGGSLSNEKIDQFIEAYLSDTLQPFVISEELPSDAERENESGLRKIVMHNFKDVVLDTTKDVLVVFHVDWCGVCKIFMPELNALAFALKKAGATDIVVSEMLMSKNDLPTDVKIAPIYKYPTIRLYKKGTKEAKEFNNDKTVATAELVLEFLRKECEVPADVLLQVPEKKKDVVQQEEMKVDL